MGTHEPLERAFELDTFHGPRQAAQELTVAVSQEDEWKFHGFLELDGELFHILVRGVAVGGEQHEMSAQEGGDLRKVQDVLHQGSALGALLAAVRDQDQA